MFILIQVLGMILIAGGGQGLIRLLIDHDDHGLLSWLPGGFGGALTGHIVIVLIGLLVGGWAADKVKKQKQAEEANQG